MPAWITLTADDLKPIVVAEQLDALRTEALADGQGDPFLEIAPTVVAKVRAFIASNPANQVSATTEAIPPELKLDVCYLILGPMLGRLGIALTKDQVTQIEVARTTLVALRDKKLVVSTPDDPITAAVQAGAGAQVVSSRSNAPTASSLDGL